MSTEELVSGVLEGLKLNALDLSALFRTALLILAGVVVIRVLLRIVDRMLSRSQNLGSVGGYIRSVVRIALWFLLVLVVADSLGIPVASMIALLSVAGLAISLALQNTLSNLAGGIMILVSKPFEVGDYVEADGVGGTVISIGLAYSTLATVDNKEIFIPNSQVAAAKIINYTKLGKRRVELTFSASYDAPTDTVKQDLQVRCQQHRICGAGVDRRGGLLGRVLRRYGGGAPRFPAPRDPDDLRSSKRPPAGEVSPQTSRAPRPRGLQGMASPWRKPSSWGERTSPPITVFL